MLISLFKNIKERNDITVAINNDTIFYNADYVVIEYIDMIKSPYILLLNSLKHNDRIREIIKVEQVEFLDELALYEWYINRKHQNFFIDLNRYPDQLTDEMMDELLDSQLSLTSKFYDYANLLSIGAFLSLEWNSKLVKDIIIYHPHSNKYAEENLERLFNRHFTFKNNFNEILNITKANSTYFLSDINKINIMKDKNLLKFSSITLPVEYRYNKKNMNDFKLDFDELYKENPFKLSYMRTCTIEKNIPNEESDEE